MDFHYLSRKELQDLCKKNKIPANMANVAIAEALEVLHKESNLQIVFLYPNTPATRSSRRMAPAVSARGKVEAQNEHKSVQGVYKSRSAMGLKEKERVRPLKMDGPCWVIEDVETKDESGLGLKEKERVRPLKMDGPCWEIEDVETKDENDKRHDNYDLQSNFANVDDKWHDNYDLQSTLQMWKSVVEII
ncbi:hypothetical protein SADUNF_Sadunf18G0048700 [Salix dunnii]|uniref:Uncharacterized protein n=1 Tax=Salix dunnii TaxID=1413687 RepID=A0A835J5H3_9ROSI|nr:hypothetical protein SADUNF_Sadunf18G0048700 [Salix dunnii]